MMGWLEQRKAYAELGRLDEKGDEDLMGCRIMRGMGVRTAPKLVYDCERALFGTTFGDTPLFTRAYNVFLHFVRQTHPWHADNWRPQVLNSSSTDKVLRRLSGGAWEGLPLLFVRFGKSKICRVFSIWQAPVLAGLSPQFTVWSCSLPEPDLRCVTHDVPEFVQQFGPFEFA